MTPKLYGTFWESWKAPAAKPRPATGSFVAIAVRTSPRPWPKSVATLVCRNSKLSTSPASRDARTRVVHIGWARPDRHSSTRCHISFTGLPIAFDTCTASTAASGHSLRPNDPPASATCTVTAARGSPNSFTMAACATFGALSGAQISARSDRTSATAQSGSRPAGLAKWNVKSPSTVSAGMGSAGTASGSSARRSSRSTVSSDLPSAVPGPQSTRRARTPSMHCPNVSPHTATPVGITTTSVIPGIANTSAAFRTPRAVPLIVGGLQTIAVLAPGMGRSRANFFSPVTAARASTRVRGVPMMPNCERGLRVTSTVSTVTLAALVARSP